MPPLLLIVVLSLLLCAGPTHQSTSEQREAIVNDLIARGHNTNVRPDGEGGARNRLVVNMTYFLYRLPREVEVGSSQVMTNGVVQMTWIDPRLTFSPDHVTSIRLDASLIWTPDIEDYYTDFPSMKTLNRKDQVVLYSDGTVNWLPHVNMNALCEPTVSYFYPSMNCTIRFASWAYNGYDLDLLPQIMHDDYLSDFIPPGRWSVDAVSTVRGVKFYPCCSEPYPYIDFRFRLARN